MTRRSSGGATSRKKRARVEAISGGEHSVADSSGDAQQSRKRARVKSSSGFKMRAMKAKPGLPTCKACQRAKCKTMRAKLCRKCFTTNAISNGGRSSGNALTGKSKKRAGGRSSGNVIIGTGKKRAGKRSWLKRQTSDPFVITPHWLELILRRKKTWEVRGTPTAKRGLIHLAVSGGGGLILGKASLVDCLPLKNDELRRHEDKHCIPEKDLPLVKYRKIFAWVFKDASRYQTPLKYKHSQGAIVWAKPHRWFVK